MSRRPPPPSGPKFDAHGALVPVRGFSRWPTRMTVWTMWVSHDGLQVISALEESLLPGSGTPPLTGPQWHLSVVRRFGGVEARCRVTVADVEHVQACFMLPAFEEDNHHPGVARHLWCPVDVRYQLACECKLTEISITDGDFTWTTEATSCRGCEFQRMSGMPCPVHAPAPA